MFVQIKYYTKNLINMTPEELEIINSPLAYDGGVGIPYKGGRASEVGVMRDKYGRQHAFL